MYWEVIRSYRQNRTSNVHNSSLQENTSALFQTPNDPLLGQWDFARTLQIGL